MYFQSQHTSQHVSKSVTSLQWSCPEIVYVICLRAIIWLKSYDWKTPAEINIPKYPAYELLRHAIICRIMPICGLTALKSAWMRCSTLSARVASIPAENGLKKGNRVGILLPNCPQFVIAFWAALMAGGIVV